MNEKLTEHLPRIAIEAALFAIIAIAGMSIASKFGRPSVDWPDDIAPRDVMAKIVTLEDTFAMVEVLGRLDKIESSLAIRWPDGVAPRDVLKRLDVIEQKIDNHDKDA